MRWRVHVAPSGGYCLMWLVDQMTWDSLWLSPVCSWRLFRETRLKHKCYHTGLAHQTTKLIPWAEPHSKCPAITCVAIPLNMPSKASASLLLNTQQISGWQPSYKMMSENNHSSSRTLQLGSLFLWALLCSKLALESFMYICILTPTNT
jgi:hypothetical protein